MTDSDKTALKAELALLRFNELTALAKRLRGGPLGFDPNRKFQRPMKDNFAEWIVAEWPASLIRDTMIQLASETPAEEAPKAPAAKPAGGDQQAASVAAAIAGALGGLSFGLTAEQTEAIAKRVAEGVAGPIALKAAEKAIADATIPRPITVIRKDGEGNETGKTDLGHQHMTFETLLKVCTTRGGDGYALNTWLVGPAGSGKTTAAKNVAKAMGLPFYFNGAIDNEYKLLGFTDAQGRIVSRPFREAWVNGGVYLFDEVDASLPGAVLAFNAALANGSCDFPDGNIERHADCIVIACANTFGSGATSEYVGRMKMDAAFVDRFVQLQWDYDETLERALSGNDTWVRKVHKVRKAVRDLGIRHVVSPRASMFGAAMLANGFPEVEVIEMTVRKGLSDEQWSSIRSKAGL